MRKIVATPGWWASRPGSVGSSRTRWPLLVVGVIVLGIGVAGLVRAHHGGAAEVLGAGLAAAHPESGALGGGAARRASLRVESWDGGAAAPGLEAGRGARGAAMSGSVEDADAVRAREVAALGRTGADGAFIVTVTGVRCGVPRVGPATPRGRFCLVGVLVENAGDEPRRLDGSAQRAVDLHGRAYAVDGRAAAFLGERLLEAVPAATTVRGVLPFDVPAGTRLSALLIHGSDRGRGGQIPLS